MPGKFITITVELPEELLTVLGLSTRAAAKKMKECLVMHFVRKRKLTQGQAAKVLKVDRWEMMDLMGKYEVPSGPTTIEELNEELAVIRKLRKKK